MEALVLGGSRFIGLHLVRLLSEQGHDVTVLNRGQTPVEFPDGVETLTADRTNPDQVKAALEGTSYDVAFDISGYT
ncbi:MAG TPA: NAD-dependent epimerase, partial [Dehalococcoidia bacterium]|nr:NAD-dependent epimerase [Dehalococcoidia bacterium]